MRTYQLERTGQFAIDRNLQGIANALKDVQSQPTMLGTLGGKTRVTLVSDSMMDEATCIYRGDGGHTLTLAAAASMGPNVSRWFVVWNDGPGTLTVAPVSGDSLSGSTSVTTATAALFVTDGVNKVRRVV